MSRSDEQRIADILDACHELATVVQIRAASAVPEPVLLRAAERLLEIIGEAASTVTDEARDRYPGVDWRSIARLRIVLAITTTALIRT
jgi:uncharacterized protein with HEPN domain